MRILILGDINSAHIKRWSGALVERGLTIGIYSIDAPHSNWYQEVGVELLSESVLNEDRSLLVRFSYYKHRKHVKRIVDEFKPDVLHAHYASSYGMLGRSTNFHPFIISAWGSDVFEFPKKNFLTSTILRKNFYAADKILATGIALQKETQKYTKKEVGVIPFGIDAQLFHPIDKPKSEIITIGLIKAMEDIYGVDVLIDAFSLLYSENENLRLLLVGDGSKLKSYKLRILSLGLEKVVRFSGRKEVEELPLYFSFMDICVFPSRMESFGVAILEASACGKPVIGSNIGGIPEVIQDEKTGILLKSNGALALVDAIKRLVNDRELRERMGEEGRKFVIENYAFRGNVDKMIETYSSLIPVK